MKETYLKVIISQILKSIQYESNCAQSQTGKTILNIFIIDKNLYD